MDNGFNNIKAIEIFGKYNVDMDVDSPNTTFDKRLNRLTNYLDLQVVMKWALPMLPTGRKPDILDVGAGKGRMTQYFSRLANHCVALEPFPEFYRVIEDRFRTFKNVETLQCRLEEYVDITEQRFDFIYVSGVTPYLSDSESVKFFKQIEILMRPAALLCVRGLGSETTTIYRENEINRTTHHIMEIAAQAELQVVRQRRAYPFIVTHKIFKLWPNWLTMQLWDMTSREAFFLFWQLLAQMNIPRGGRNCFFVYLFKKRSLDVQRPNRPDKSL